MLDGEMMRHVAAHLRICADCRRVCEGLSQTKSLLAGLSAPSQPSQSDFWNQTYRRARLEARKGSGRGFAFLSGWPSLKYRWSIAAATAGVALAAALIALSPSPQPHVKGPATAPAGPVLDVSQVVRAHADYAAEQPLADDSRLSIVLSDPSQIDSQSADADSDDSAAPPPSGSNATSDFSGSQAVQNAAGALD